MAFNPDIGGVPSANMSDQTGASRGSIPDRSLEAIAEGIGGAIKGGVNLYNEWNHNEIDNKVRSGFDEVNKPYTDILPKDLTNTEAVLGSLQNAFEQGKISDVYYTGQLAKLQKQLRSQYPQYEDYIDSSLQKITGIRPANAFKSAINQAISDEATKSAESEKNWREWTEQNGDWISQSFPDYFTNPEKYVGQEGMIRSKVYENQSVALENTNENSRLARLSAAGQLSRQDAKAGALRTAETTVRNMLEATSNATGILGGQDLYKMLQSFMEDDVISDEEYAQGTQMINEFDKNIRLALTMQMATPVDPSDPESVSFNVMVNDPTAIKEAIDGALAPWETIKQYALDKDFGLFTYYSRMTTLMKDREVNQLLGSSPTLQKLNAIKELGGPDLADAFLSETAPKGDNQSSIFAEITPELEARFELGQADFTDTVNSIVDGGKSDEEKSKGVNSVIDAAIARLTSGTITPEGLNNLVNSVYKYDAEGKSIFTKVVPGEREALFRNLYQPAVTDALVKSGDKQMLKTYYDSMLASSKMVQSFTEAAAAIQDTVNYSVADTIQYVPAQGPNPAMFVVKTDASRYGSVTYFPGVTGTNPYDQFATTKAMTAVNSLNNVLASINPVLTGLGSDDTVKNEQVQQYVKMLGIDLGAAKPESFFDQLGKVVQKGIESLTNGIEQPKSNQSFESVTDGAPVDDTFTLELPPATVSPATGDYGDISNTIIGFEGYRDTAYWDVNAYRTGFGSDTITLEDGTVQKVTKGTKINRADAERDLARRINEEFIPSIVSEVGQEAWDALSVGTKKALASITYNYGDLPNSIAKAVKSGDVEAIKAAIENRRNDNAGVNYKRRMTEASFVG